MGERTCSVEGCNALEFRNMGVCNRHLHEGVEPLPAAMKAKKEDIKEIAPSFLNDNVQHKKFCQILMAMAFGGGFSAMIGYHILDSCSDDTIFEAFGIFVFWMSMFGVPMNVLILFLSFFNPQFDSKTVFVWIFLHFSILLISMTLFGEYLTQDMFCGCWGFPGEDCSSK